MKVTPSVLIISKVLRAEATGSIITYVLFFFWGGEKEGGVISLSFLEELLTVEGKLLAGI